MKTKFCTLLVAALLLSSISFATIRWVSEFSFQYPNKPLTHGFEDAQNASSPGDTIQYSGSELWGNTVVTKRLVIMGFGYNFSVHPNLQANTPPPDNPSHIGSITFGSGSEGSVIEGCSGQMFYIATDNITIRRCMVTQIYFVVDTSAIDNAVVESCVIGEALITTFDNPCTNVHFCNSIAQRLSFGLATSSGIVTNCVSSVNGNQWEFRNASFHVKNCIVAYFSNNNNTNTTYDNNFFGEPAPATALMGGNNVFSQDWGVLFNRLGGTDDSPGVPNDVAFDENYYILKAGSPAIGKGINDAGMATDLGIHGGEPACLYGLSGQSPIPAFTAVAAATLNPFNMKVSVISHN